MVVNMRVGHPKDPRTHEIRARAGGNNILCMIVTVTSYLMKNAVLLRISYLLCLHLGCLRASKYSWPFVLYTDASYFMKRWICHKYPMQLSSERYFIMNMAVIRDDLPILH